MSTAKRSVKTGNIPEPEAANVVEMGRDGTGALSHQLLDELFGDGVGKVWPLNWYFAQPVERRQLWLVILGAALLFLPWLGAVGLWDPWESQFAEVGREMIARNDWVHPWWERTNFYSKPPLTMWLTNLGLLLTSSNAGERGSEIGIWAEWGMRLPITLLSIGAVGMLYLTCARIFRVEKGTDGRRIGLIAALACSTMPLYAILARQAITDTPFVALLTMAMCCFLIAEFDPEVKHRDPWLFSFYALIGLSTLAKEIPFGFGVPGGVVLLYLLLTGDWLLLTRVRLFWGSVLCLAISVPYVLFMGFTKDTEEEGETFFHRYWLHDNFSRLFSGVHTTSPNAPFVYYIEQLGYGAYPWSALLPGIVSAGLGIDPKKPEDRSRVFIGLWALVPFLVISLSATKFEHYDLPCMPPLAILCGLYLDKLWREGVRKHTFNLLLGGGLFAMIGQNYWQRPKLITEMFTYNPDRPYPPNLIADPAPIVWALILVGGGLAILGLLRKGKALYVGGVALVLGIAIYATTHTGGVVTSHWAPKDVMGGIALLFGLTCLGAVISQQREWLIASFCACAVAFATYLTWVHWVQLSVHWEDRELMHTYYSQRQPGEPLAAYLMNWKGETFYTKNEVRQIQDPRKLQEFFREPAGPGGRHWIITDSRYFPKVQQELTSQGHKVEIHDDRSVKFKLVTVE